MSPPTPMIPRIHDVLSTLSKKKYFISSDGVSYFYQYEMSESIRSHFGVDINKGRGSPTRYRLCRLPMGWKYSPCIAQRGSNVIVNETIVRLKDKGVIDPVGFCWIDNFLFGFDSESDAIQGALVLRQVADECNLLLDKSHFEVKEVLEALGFLISFRSVRHSPKFVSKTLGVFDSLNSITSFRKLSSFIGQFVWSTYVRRIPLCCFPYLLDLLRSIHICVRTMGDWEAPCGLNLDDMIAEVNSTVATIMHPFGFNAPDSDSTFVELFSDASQEAGVTRWAWLSGSASHSGTFQGNPHIFLAELLAGAQALYMASKKSNKALLWIDNTAALFALRNGHSGNYYADTVLRRLFNSLPANFEFYVCHVASDFNEADKFTRGVTSSEDGVWSSTMLG